MKRNAFIIPVGDTSLARYNPLLRKRHQTCRSDVLPAYDYRCNACRRRVLLTFKTYREYDTATKHCPHCGSADLTRLIGRVGIARSDISRLDSMPEESAMEHLADADPATLGRYLRQMGDTVGEDLGDEFGEVVNRLERGESPEDIEASMPDLAAGMDSSPSAGSDDLMAE